MAWALPNCTAGPNDAMGAPACDDEDGCETTWPPGETVPMISACTIPQLDEATFDEAVLASPFPVFVHFVERDCHGCEIAQGCLAAVTAQLPGRVGCFCVQGAANPEVAARYRIGQYPTILLFREGRVARRLVGHPLPGELEIIFRTESP